ncbi:MAG: hypothetical protein GXC73_18975 [Chitinophagaceae bacterium]|nr:hypothetical protein [Chitinophagaceae bacterium]
MSDNMMFATEKDLVSQLKLNYGSICNWKPSSVRLLEEVDLGFGIADLVLSRLSSRSIYGKSILTYFDANIYKLIEVNQKVTIEQLQEITKASISEINKSINKLMLDSYIKKRDSLICFKKPYQSVALESIAIEAKLKNWKKALMQAYRYQWFASYSYVVLDSKFVLPAIKNINEFEKLNIGLAEINKSGKLQIISKPYKISPKDPRMNIILNEQLKTSLLKL